MSRQNKARRNKVIKLQILAIHKKEAKNTRTKKLHNKKQVKRAGVVTGRVVSSPTSTINLVEVARQYVTENA